MKRLCVALACLALASPAWAAKTRRVPVRGPNPLAPVTARIAGGPLTIVIGDDTSTQVSNSNVPGSGQFYPPDCGAGETADTGLFVGRRHRLRTGLPQSSVRLRGEHLHAVDPGLLSR